MHYKLAFEQHETPSSPEATALLNSSAHYLHLRARIEDSGSAEERWWAAVMLGQLFLYDTDKKVRRDTCTRSVSDDQQLAFDMNSRSEKMTEGSVRK